MLINRQTTFLIIFIKKNFYLYVLYGFILTKELYNNKKNRIKEKRFSTKTTCLHDQTHWMIYFCNFYTDPQCSFDPYYSLSLVYLGYITLSKQWQDCFQNVLIEKTVSVTFEMSATALVGMTTYYLSATFQPLKPSRLF